MRVNYRDYPDKNREKCEEISTLVLCLLTFLFLTLHFTSFYVSLSQNDDRSECLKLSQRKIQDRVVGDVISGDGKCQKPCVGKDTCGWTVKNVGEGLTDREHVIDDWMIFRNQNLLVGETYLNICSDSK